MSRNGLEAAPEAAGIEPEGTVKNGSAGTGVPEAAARAGVRAQDGSGEPARASSDAVAVALEVSRVLRGFRFYPGDDPRRTELLGRGFQCVRAELDRHGPLELELADAGLRWRDAPLPLALASVDDLVRAMRAQTRPRLCLDAGLDATGFARLVETLAGDAPHAPGGTLPLGLPPATAAAPAEAPASAFAAAPPAAAADDHATVLWALVGCRDDAEYAALAARARAAADAAFDARDTDAGHEILFTLGTHASDPRRSAAQREAAQRELCALAQGERLGALLDRACAEDVAASIRASQLLLQLGVGVVPTLLRDITRARDANRRGQLTGILIAMGEPAAPAIVQALESGDERQERLAAQLAGDIQHPAAVAPLRRLLSREDPELRREVAKALAKIGHPSAIDALVAALGSRTPGVPALAAYCLGVTSSSRAASGLCEALRAAMTRGDFALAREIVRSLGRLARPATVPELSAVLDRRSVFQRKALRELKGIVIETLAKMTGEEALKALSAAAASRDEPVAEIARRALARTPGTGSAEPASA
jgi:HEAT repeat protein